MRKIIFMAIASFVWKKYQEKRAASRATTTNDRTV
jgi:hypothetical protein